MSVKASSWAWDQPVSGNQKLVLLALADHANDEGKCWPGIASVAIKTGLSKSTVNRIIVHLVDAGLLSYEPHFDEITGRQISNLYTLNMQNREGVSMTGGGCQHDRGEGVTRDRGEGVKLTPPIRMNRNKEPSEGKDLLSDPHKNLTESAESVLEFINRKVKRRWPGRNPKGKPTANIRIIIDRLKEGYTVDQCRQVFVNKWFEWKDDPKMKKYLSPSTIFRASNFSNYIGNCVIQEDEQHG